MTLPTPRRSLLSLCALGAVLLAPVAWQDAVAPPDESAPAAAARPPRPAAPLVDGVLELAPLSWWLDGEPLQLGPDGQPSGASSSVSHVGPSMVSAPVAPLVLEGEQGELVELTYYVVGGSWPRWSTVFTTEAACMARLTLEWEGGPDGALFEVVLDGRRLSPPRDAWRPSDRPLTSDLGPAWLGEGRHLLEFVLRERTIPSTLRLKRLRAECLGDLEGMPEPMPRPEPEKTPAEPAPR